MSLQGVLEAYASRSGLEAVTPKPDGSYVLVFDERFKVRLIPEGTAAARLQSRIAPLPADDRERLEFLDRLLNAATGRMRASPEILTATEDEGALILFRRIATGLSPHAFEAVLTSFINSLAFWQRQAAAASQGPTAAPLPMMPMMMHRRAL